MTEINITENVKPTPTKKNVLERIKSHITITSVVDVGVQKKTGELIHAFPNLHHYLFEPASSFYPDIENNYKNIDYTLYKMALSDICTTNYLITTSLEKNGKATHSHIAQENVTVDGNFYLSSDSIEVNRFDTTALAETIESNFLLKVDVDGKDLNVLQGFGNKLQLAAVVIVECTLPQLTKRVAYIENSGFTLIDLVDLVYYGDSMYQLDAVLIRNDLINNNIKPPITDFKKNLWHSLKFDTTA